MVASTCWAGKRIKKKKMNADDDDDDDMVR